MTTTTPPRVQNVEERRRVANRAAIEVVFDLAPELAEQLLDALTDGSLVPPLNLPLSLTGDVAQRHAALTHWLGLSQTQLPEPYWAGILVRHLRPNVRLIEWTVKHALVVGVEPSEAN